MSTDRKEKLLELFNQRAPIAKTFGMKLSFDVDDRANISLPYNPDLDHALGGVHGGVIATLLDNAGWFSCALAHEGSGWVVTSEMSLHLFQPVKKSDLDSLRGRNITITPLTADMTGQKVDLQGTLGKLAP